MAGANTLSLRPNSNLGDGILTIKELSNLNLRTTQLAVLSACQTGVGDITTEGVFGLQRAFKIAGVRSLIVSLWEVNDAVTAKLMTSFYKALLLNYDYYTAFSIAIENVRKTKFNIQGTSVSGDKIELFGAFVLVD
jgi:CHAT domain-containing protein